MLLTLRVFVSSPGDVGEERLTAERVMKRLAGEFGRAADLRPYFWEHEPLRATTDFQSQIVSPDNCDIVVCILWSRIGTRLAGDFKRPDGTSYSSGTEFEFETAAEAYRRKGVPDLLAYRKTKALTADLSDETQLEERRRQYRALEDFVARWFERDGAFKAAFKTFDTTATFEKILESDLRKLITERLRNYVGTVSEAAPEVSWFSGSPFMGLQAFDYQHSGVFFGRTRAIAEIKDTLVSQAARGCAFLLVFGASGAGKSSVMRAGVIPTVTQPGVVEGIGLWRWCVMRPSDAGDDLFEALAGLLFSPATCPHLGSTGISQSQLSAMLREAPERALAPLKAALTRDAEEVARAERLVAPPHARLLIAIDQMEELFTLERVQPNDRAAFVAALSTLARSGFAWVIGTMRSDFYARCAELPELLALKAGAGQYDLEPPTFDELGQMILWPARAAGLGFEHRPQTDERLDAILHEAASKAPEALPLLEFTLAELYKARSEAGVLTFAAYRELGGLEGALARRAEEEFSKLSAAAQQEMPGVFRTLVTIREGAEEVVVGRRMPAAALETSAERKAAVTSFVDARLLVSDEGIVALGHEALLRHWDRLAQWIENDRDMLRTRARVAELATLWRNESKRRDLLLQPGRLLAAAEELIATRRGDLDASLIEFIEASAAGRKRRERIRRAAVAGVCVVAAVMSVLAVLAYRNAQEARRQSTVALARQLSAQARLIEHDSPDLLERAALLAVESARRTHLVEDETFLRRAAALLPRVAFVDGFSGQVYAESFSPDGSQLAVGAGKEALVLQARTGKVQSRLVHEGTVWAVSFSPDGRYVATGSDDGTARVFEAVSGKERLRLALRSPVWSARFSPDGHYLATGSDDGVARVFESTSGREVSQLKLGGKVWDVAFSPNGRLIAVASADHTARVFDASTGKEISRLEHGNWVEAVAFSPDGTRVATASWDRTARVFEASTGRELSRLTHDARVRIVTFSPDGRYVASGSDDGTARVFEAATGKEVSRMVHGGPIRDVAFDPTGRYVASGSDDRTARVFEAATGKEVSRMGHGGWARVVAFSRDGRYVASGSVDAHVRMFEAVADNPISRLPRTANVDIAEFSGDARYIATAGNAIVRVFVTDTATEICALPQTSRVWAIAFSRDAHYLAEGNADKVARVFELPSGREVSRLVNGGWVYSIAFSTDDRYVVTGSDDSNVRIFDTFNGREIMRFAQRASVWAVAFSPDGHLVASGSDDNVVRVFNLAARRTSLQIAHSLPVWDLAFSSDGRYLATGSDDRTSRVLDPVTGIELLRLHHDDTVTGVSFSADGKYLTTLSDDASARIFETRSGTELARLIQPHGILAAHLGRRETQVLIAHPSTDGSEVVIERSPVSLNDLVNDVCSRLTRNLTREEWQRYLPGAYQRTCPQLP